MKAALSAIFVLFVLLLQAQNLVPNPSFEEHSRCPDAISELNRVKSWYSPTKGSPDYYCTCANEDNNYSTVGVPTNQMGKQTARTGEAYVGIIAFNVMSDTNEREYLEVKLTEPLKADSVYCLTFYVSFAGLSGYCTDALGAHISVKSMKGRGWVRLVAKPQVENKPGDVMYKTDWIPLSGRYTATGGEQYLTIGDFQHPDSLKIKPTKHSFFSGYAYYYIDDVSLMPLNSPGCLCNEEKHRLIKTDSVPPAKADFIVPDSSIILNNIFFETDKAVLLPPSYPELDKLVTYLTTHKAYQIALSGYTDNTGIEPHNQQLSEARAQSVAGYLIFKGVDKNRISYEGFGSTHPIATNDTPEGRQKNRRVEFKLSLPK